MRIEETGSFPASWCLRLRVKNEKTQKKPPPPLCLFPLSLLCFWLLGALHDPCHRTPKILCSCWLGGWACLPACLSYCLMHRVPSCRQGQRIRSPPHYVHSFSHVNGDKLEEPCFSGITL